MEVDSKKLQELYVAFFGRPADPPGIQYWLLQASKGIKLREIASVPDSGNSAKTSPHMPTFQNLKSWAD